MRELTMEQIFVVTYLGAAIIGIGLGILLYFLLYKNDKR